MTWYVENPTYYEAIEECRGELADLQFDEVSLTVVFHCCKLKNYSHKSKICVLELLAENLERDIELLNTQIHSYNFQSPKQFYEELTSPKPKDIVSSFDFLIEEYVVCKHKSEIEQLQSWYNIEDTNGKIIHVKMLKENL